MRIDVTFGIKQVVSRVINELVEYGIIKNEDVPICYFGLYEGIIFILEVALTLAIAVLMNNMIGGTIFLFSFLPIRRMAGGYHAETRERCLIISVLIIIIAMHGIKILQEFKSLFLIGLFVTNSVAIMRIAPIESVKKQLSFNERSAYKIKLKKILVVEFMISVVLGFHERRIPLASITMAGTVGLFLCILGMRNRK